MTPQHLQRPVAFPFLTGDYAFFTAEALGTHFSERERPRYFTLGPGADKHVARARKLLANEFEFNNESHRLSDPIDWHHNPSHDLEWLILLHKFYYLRDLALSYHYTNQQIYADKWMQLITTWIDNVAVGYIDSQVTGRRIQQWIHSFQYFVPRRSPRVVPVAFLSMFLDSIARQADYLLNHLTPAGNHRTLELYALYLVATQFPELGVASRCSQVAKAEMLRNIRTDLLADGVQRELSTDYHHTVLKNYFRFRVLAALNEDSLDPAFDHLVRNALRFSFYVHKPDGTIPAFNDGDPNSYLSLLKKAALFYDDKELLFASTYGTQGVAPRERSQLFPASGYSVLRSDWRTDAFRAGRFLCFDCGALGFGSHGHYDLLNFEYAAYGATLIVDPGRYTYSEESDDGINWRRYFKGTSAHNTIVVDGHDQAPYRCEAPSGPEPQARVERFTTAPGFDFVQGIAVSPEYEVQHRRALLFLPDDYVVVMDTLIAAARHRYDQYFHLTPHALDHVSSVANADFIAVTSPRLTLFQHRYDGLEIALETGFVAPEYGVKFPAPVVRSTVYANGPARFFTVLVPRADHRAHVQVTNLKVTPVHAHCSGDGDDSFCMQLVTSGADGTCTDDIYVRNQGSHDVVRFADIHVRSRLLWLRRTATGQIIGLHADGLEALAVNGRTLFDGNVRTTLSTVDKVLHLRNDLGANRTIPLAMLEQMQCASRLP